jgi:hypothetical protein
MSYRLTVQELDFSGFVQNTNFQNGAMVIDADMGDEFPVLIQDENTFLTLFGKPSALKWGGFEALTYITEAPLFVSAPFGAGALWAGVDVFSNEVRGFGKRTGRNFRAFNNYNSIQVDATYQHDTPGDGVVASFSGRLPNTNVLAVQAYLGDKLVAESDSIGAWIFPNPNLTGAGVMNLSTGEYSLTFNGLPGTVAEYHSDEKPTGVDLSGGVNLEAVASSGFAEVDFSIPISGTQVLGLPTDTYSIRLAIDGGALTEYSFDVNVSDTWSTIIATINNLTGIAGNASVSIVGGRLKISSLTKGSSSSITIADGSTNPFFAAINSIGNLTSLLSPVNGLNAGVKITVDQVTIDNIDLGADPNTSQASIITAINALFLSSPIAQNVASVHNSKYIKITGKTRNPLYGKIRISAPSTLPSAVAAVFDSSFTGGALEETIKAAHPVGSIPKEGQYLVFKYIYNTNYSTSVSHSFFARSPYNDSTFQLGVDIQWLGGTQFSMTLYEKKGGKYYKISEYTYSLQKEKNGFGKSIYIFDVFKDNLYVIPYVNPSFTGTYSTFNNITPVDFSGGYRGAPLTNAEFNAAWNLFQFKNKYPVKTFMDIYGNSPNTISNLINSYQEYSFGITVVPFGNNVDEAIAYRQLIGIDNSKMAMYTNWMEIEDVFNNSSAWVSGVGKIGVKYAQMNDVFDGMPPAGIDENNHGGQIGNVGYKILRLERDYTNADLKKLDEAQINPIIVKGNFGPLIYGNKTLQVALSDTSYIHTRRVYNYLIQGVIEQILQRQEFKFNDDYHRSQIKILTEQFIAPITNAGVLTEVLVECSDKNNTPEVLNQRRFVLDIYVKATPTSEFITFRLIRVSQTQTLVAFL